MLVKKEQEWNKSYQNRDNFVFYPHEDVIRFISKYIRKRVGLNKFVDQNEYNDIPKVLDFGCGIGRHIILLDDFGIDGYGFDLSGEAISVAKNNFEQLGYRKLIDKVTVADITKLPYEDKSFDFMLSHGVLDSMPLEIAQNGIIELHRCLKDSAKMYFDVISVDDSTCELNQLEKTINNEHEYGTIQSFFDIEKINVLIDNFFIINDITISTKEDILTKTKQSRYHIVVEKKQ